MDKLRLEYINSLPQPFLARFCGERDMWWPIYDIAVDHAICRIDVCGKLQVKPFSEIMEIKDEAGNAHDPEDWWIE